MCVCVYVDVYRSWDLDTNWDVLLVSSNVMWCGMYVNVETSFWRSFLWWCAQFVFLFFFFFHILIFCLDIKKPTCMLVLYTVGSCYDIVTNFTELFYYKYNTVFLTWIHWNCVLNWGSELLSKLNMLHN